MAFDALTPRINPLEDPSLQTDNALATKLGQKIYLAGTAYNGSNSPTLTNSPISLSSTTRGIFIPYQMQDGSWRLRFNIKCVTASSIATNTPYTLTINGVTFKNVSGYDQAIAYNTGGNTQWTGSTSCLAEVMPNTSTIKYVAGVSNDEHSFSGDVELDSKPTWAY